MEIILEGDKIRSEFDLHRILAEKLDFGQYYGNNKAALRDRLTEGFEQPIHLIWKNAALSRQTIGEVNFAKLIQLFRDVEQRSRDLGLRNAFTFSAPDI